MTTATLLSIDPQTIHRCWLEIVRRHEEAKALARCGQLQAARALVEKVLPGLIRRWGRMSGLPRHLQILRLRKQLQGDLAIALRPRPTRRTAPEPLLKVLPAKSNHRIPLENVPARSDAAHLAAVPSRRAREWTPLPLAS